MGAHAYATTNLLSGLASAAYTWGNAYAGTDKALVNDARMDKRLQPGSGHGAGCSVVIDMGSAVQMSGFAVLNHNIVTLYGSTAPTLRIRAADDAAITVGVVTTKAATTLATYLSLNTREPMNKDHVLQFAAVTKRYWELTFVCSGAMVNAPAFGEFFAFNTQTSLSRKGIYGSGDGVKMYTAELELANGETRGLFLGGPVREKTLRWADFDSADRDELRTLFYATAGNSGKLLFINSYEAVSTAAAATEQDCIYGRLTGLDELPFNEMDFSLYQLPDFVIRSLGREVGA